MNRNKRSPIFWDKVLVVLFGLFLSLTLIASIYQKYGEYAFGSLLFTGIFWAMPVTNVLRLEL